MIVYTLTYLQCVSITYQVMVSLTAPWLVFATVLLSQEATADPKILLVTTQDDTKKANEGFKDYQLPMTKNNVDNYDYKTMWTDNDLCG